MSKVIVDRSRLLRRGVPTLFLSVGALLLFVWVLLQIEQHFFRRRAELLLNDIQSIELRKTSWGDAQARLQRWRSKSVVDNDCDEHRCNLKISLEELVFAHISGRNAFERLDDYLRWRFKLDYGPGMGPFQRAEAAVFRVYLTVGGRPSRVIATVGMRDGIAWKKGFGVFIETYADNDTDLWWDSDYTLIAEIDAVSRFPSGVSLQHPSYAIGRPGGCEICVMGWVKFTPYADPADARRLMRLDLSCLTRWRPCLTQRDIMPAAWAEHAAEERSEETQKIQAGCSSLVVELLGRDMARIGTGEILGYRATASGERHQDGIARVRMLEQLKEAAGWKVGDVRDVNVSMRSDLQNAQLRAGTKLILFAHWDSDEMEIAPVYDCPVVVANDSNVALVRKGIAQDYSASNAKR